mmetsp:Transcript_19821/g.29250  ORF Transcript_19821/g.29250 Transcript_19821/m.29250 type:complete len:243 (-) Transcript_19821:667-1395(-)
MEKWANLYPNVRFLTVCVDSLGVAKSFASMFGFNKVVNCHIPSRRYFPVGYGQLGCSGFVVVDERGCFVSRKTMAYLQYGEAAFTYVENLLERVFDVRPMYRSSTADAVPAFMMVGREEQEKKEEKEEELDMGAPVPSVGISSMDAEHEKCEKALSLLLAMPNSKNLENALIELVEHFQHEEQLMKTHGFGRSNQEDDFSPFASHVKDHERILDMGYRELGRCTQNAQEQMVCSKNASGSSS